MATSLDILKFNLQERTYPYFTDDELQMLLDTSNNDINKASYRGCLLKAEAADGVEVKGVVLGSNRAYWLTLAQNYKDEVDKLKNAYITSRVRADGC